MAQYQIGGFAVITGVTSTPNSACQLVDFCAIIQGTGGIGKETGFTFAESGSKGVLFADLDATASAQAAEQSKKIAIYPGYKAIGTKVDVTDSQSVQYMIDLAVREFGRIDYCINAAGVSYKSLAFVI